MLVKMCRHCNHTQMMCSYFGNSLIFSQEVKCSHVRKRTLKTKKEGPVPAKTKAKANALKAKKAVLIDIHSHKKDLHIDTFQRPNTLALETS